MNKLPKRHFWDWFKRNNQEYLTLDKKSKKEISYWFYELDAHLIAYSEFFEFAVVFSRDQPATLIISTNGNAMYFDEVDHMVAKAPVIPGWTFKALEDPQPIDFALEQEILDTGIDPHELSFSFISDDPDEPGISIYHPLCTRDNKYQIKDIANAALYNILGERSFGTEIIVLEVLNLSRADADEVYELEALPGLIGMRHSPIVVDERGSLIDTHS